MRSPERRRRSELLALTSIVVVFAALAAALFIASLRIGSGASHTEPPAASNTDVPPDSSPETTADSLPADSTSVAQTETTTESPPETEPLKETSYDSFTVSFRNAPSEKSIASLADALSAFGRPVSLYALDLESETAICRNADAPVDTASIVKVIYALYVSKLIDSGEAKLDEILTYTSADTVHGNGAIGKMGVGAKLTLHDVLYHTINTSDNEGYYMLVRRFGRSGCDDMARSLGCTTYDLTSSRWCKVSARDLSLIWTEIYRRRDESEGGRLLWEMLTTVSLRHFIRDALDDDRTVANKAGWNGDTLADSAIVIGERTYILIILTEGSFYSANISAFNSIVRAADAIMNEIG